MQRAHITPYAISYTLWYIALTVLVALLFALLNWPGGVGTILLIAFGASWHAGRKFARHLGRAPTTLEGRAYSWRALLGCFLATTALSFLVAWLGALAAGAAELSKHRICLSGLGRDAAFGRLVLRGDSPGLCLGGGALRGAGLKLLLNRLGRVQLGAGFQRYAAGGIRKISTITGVQNRTR